MKPNPLHKEFSASIICNRHLEFLAHMGQPMLYDGDLYVLREPPKTQLEYYRWFKGIRVA